MVGKYGMVGSMVGVVKSAMVSMVKVWYRYVGWYISNVYVTIITILLPYFYHYKFFMVSMVIYHTYGKSMVKVW